MKTYLLPDIDDIAECKSDFAIEEKDKRLYQDFVFWDIETTERKEGDNRKLDFDMCVLKVVRLNNEKDFKIISEFRCLNIIDFESAVKTIINRYYKTVFIAHNTAFDIRYSNLLPILKRAKFEITMYYETMSTFVMSVQNDEHRVMFIDSMNWFSTKLGNLAKLVNMDKDMSKMTSENRAEKLEYCSNDVDILIAVFDRYKKWLWNNFTLNMKLTRGSDAFNLFRHTISKDLIRRSNNITHLRKEFGSYFGGRTEAFKIGKLPDEKWYKFDINSLYPFVMVHEDYPVRLLDSYFKITPDQAISKLDGHVGLAYVQADIDFPAIPVMNKKSPFYPIGKIGGYYTGKELEWILLHGTDIYIDEFHVYESKPIFKQVITELNSFKEKASQEGNELDRTNVKLIMNSIYGKFAQRNEQLEYSREALPNEVNDLYEVNDNNKLVLRERILNGDMYSVSNNILSAYSFPLIAACVTSNARQYLWDFMYKCGLNHIAYVDTDSIITNQAGNGPLMDNLDDTIMGKWKLEGVSNNVNIRGLKDYTFDGVDTIKGVPKRSEKLSDNTFKYERIGSLKETKAGTLTKPNDVHTVVKTLRRQYEKSILCTNCGYHAYKNVKFDHLLEI